MRCAAAQHGDRRTADAPGATRARARLPAQRADAGRARPRHSADVPRARRCGALAVPALRCAAAEQRIELRYFPLSRRYQLRDLDAGADVRSFATPAYLLAGLNSLRLPLPAKFTTLPRGATVRVDAALETGALPGALRLPAPCSKLGLAALLRGVRMATRGWLKFALRRALPALAVLALLLASLKLAEDAAEAGGDRFSTTAGSSARRRWHWACCWRSRSAQRLCADCASISSATHPARRLGRRLLVMLVAARGAAGGRRVRVRVALPRRDDR